jgi:Domain of unknown function (DUF4350)
VTYATDTSPAPATTAEPAAARQVAARRWRRSRWVLAAVVALVALGVGLAALQPRVQGAYLDPDSPSQQGTRALVQITRQHGTPVTIVRTVAAAAADLGSNPDALLVVVRPERLVASDLTTLSGLPGDRLLVEPDDTTLRRLAPGVSMIGGADLSLEPDCALSAATLAGDVGFTDSQTYDAPASATKCYPSSGDAALVQLRVGASTVTLLGSGEPLTNERLTQNGNASLGMNLLAARPSVVWLMPNLPQPGTGGQKSFFQLVPFGVKLALLQIVIAVVMIAIWRARRLGPVVAESLPVIVRSAETVEGRARLYRSRRAQGRAADALRGGSVERLKRLLGMPGAIGRHELVIAIAARCNQDEAVIGYALYGPPPADDAELVRLAYVLDDLERQVRQS